MPTPSRERWWGAVTSSSSSSHHPFYLHYAECGTGPGPVLFLLPCAKPRRFNITLGWVYVFLQQLVHHEKVLRSELKHSQALFHYYYADRLSHPCYSTLFGLYPTLQISLYGHRFRSAIWLALPASGVSSYAFHFHKFDIFPCRSNGEEKEAVKICQRHWNTTFSLSMATTNHYEYELLHNFLAIRGMSEG